MNYAYIRFSTDKQDEKQQMNTIENFLKTRGMTIDRYEKDEGVSGGKSYKDRKLKSLVDSMKKGDCLIATEISRLGRSMSDLNKLVNDDLKPRGVRLIIITMGIDLDCSNIKAVDEMLLFAFGFAAQVEKEMIQQRTRSGIGALKKAGKEVGGTESLWGSKTYQTREEAIEARSKAIEKAHTNSAIARTNKAKKNPNNIAFADFLELWIARYGRITRNTDWEKMAEELNARGKKTSTGMEFTSARAYSMYTKVKGWRDSRFV